MTVAKWRKVDLHAHTPFDRSRNWGKSAEKERSKGLATEAGQVRAWLDRCTDAGLDIVAVTDHNTLEGFDRISAAVDAWRSATGADLVVLPGVELSVTGCHFLVIGGPAERDRLDRLISHALKNREPFLENGQPQEASIGIDDFAHFVQEGVESGGNLLALPAHLQKSKGLIKELGGLLRERAFAQRAWSGFQVRGEDFKQSKELLRLWAAASLFGRRPEDLSGSQKQQFDSFVARNEARGSWPLVDASDPEGLQELGAVYSWMKMSEAGVEGIRQALLDPESRLRRYQDSPPQPPKSWIEGIEVEAPGIPGARVFTDDLRLELSSALNTLIGGRGTGKSTIIELLRWALGRDRHDDLPREDSEVRERIDQFLDEVITDESQVRVLLRCDNRPVEVVRTHDTHEARWLDTDDTSATADVRTLIEPQILSQRQINEIASQDEAIRREIDHAVGEPLRDLHGRRRELVRSLEYLQEQRRDISARLAERAPVETEIERLQGQVSSIEAAAGSPTLATYRDCQRQGRWLTDLLEAIEEATAAVPNEPLFGEQWPSPPPDGPASDPLRELAERAAHQRAHVEHARTELAQRVTELWQLVAEVRDGDFAAVEGPLSEEYKAVVSRLREQGLELGDLDALHAKLAAQRRKSEGLRQLPQQLEKLEEQITETWQELIALHDERRGLREGVAKRLADGGADIRLHVVPFGDRDEVVDQQDRWFGGTGMYRTDWETLAAWVSPSVEDEPREPANRWRRLVEALRTDSSRLREGQVETAEEVRALVGAENLSGRLERALAKVQSDRFDDMERFLPEDHVTALFRDGTGEFRPIRQASLGQQSTAVLSLLLSVGEEPLVLDQPEDDLDNRYIYEVVVELLREAKPGRQIIAATHNANIPVNGDAECIVALDGSAEEDGNILVGTLESEEMKDAVSNIMEGSEAAFRLRRHRYGY